MKLLRSLSLSFVALCAAVAFGQPTPTPTAVALTVNKTTGAITAPVAAATFGSANNLSTTTAVDGYFADPSTNGSFSASPWRSDLSVYSQAETTAEVSLRQRLHVPFFPERAWHDSPPAKAALNVASTITSAATISRSSSSLRIYRGAMASAGGSYPDELFNKPDYITTNNESSAICIEFGFDGTDFEVYTKDNGGRYRILVDGQIASSDTSLGNTGNLYYQKFTFPTRRQRIITIEGGNVFFFGGLKIGPNDSVYLPSAAPQQRVIIVGDSFTEGTGATGPFRAWSHIAADALGWDGWSSGSGSTGWATAGSNQAKFVDRLTADVINRSPDIVVFAGGINDETYYGSNGSAAYTAQVEACLDALLIGLPNLDQIVIVGPWWPSSAANANRDGVRAVLQQAAADYGAIWIDPKGWITGTGRVGTTTGTGNADLYTSSDGTHPSTAGHAYLARRFVEDYQRQLGATVDPLAQQRVASSLVSLTATATINFASMLNGADDTQTVTVDGASTATTSTVSLGWSASLETGIIVAQAWVSASNTVSIRVHNASGGTVDPAALTVRVRVQQER
jgi:lysophospholipase L1-like esterase